jgi:hypothetical protein
MKYNLFIYVKKVKSLLVSLFVVVALSSVGFVVAINRASSLPTKPAPTQPAPIVSTTPTTPSLQPSAPLLEEPAGIALKGTSDQVQWLSEQPVPWENAVQNWVNENWKTFNPEMQRRIESNWGVRMQQLQAGAQQSGHSVTQQPAVIRYQQPYGYLPVQQPIQQTPWSVGGALSGGAERAKAALYYGGSKLMGGVTGAKNLMNRALALTLGIGTVSTMGAGYKATAALGAIAMAPFVTGAAVGLGTSLAIGAGTLGLTNIVDGLESVYRTGDLLEDDGIQVAKGAIQEILKNKAIYPTISVIDEALRTPIELSSTHPDKAGFVAKAHKLLMDEYAIALQKLSPEESSLNQAVWNDVMALRNSYNGNQLSSAADYAEYAERIKKNNSLSQAHAILSEYYRALCMQGALEEALKAQTQQQNPAQVTPQATQAPTTPQPGQEVTLQQPAETQTNPATTPAATPVVKPQGALAKEWTNWWFKPKTSNPTNSQ